MPPAWLVSSMFDTDGRAMGEYGTSATNVIAEFIWMNPQVGDGGSFGGDDGVGGYAPLAVASGPVATPTLLWVHGNHLGVPQVYTTSSGAPTSPGAWQLPYFLGQRLKAMLSSPDAASIFATAKRQDQKRGDNSI